MTDEPTTNIFENADLISVYTRAQALEDGTLADLNQWIPVAESGYKYPVACTSAVFSIIERAVENKKFGNDYRGVIWDILWMSRKNQIKSWETGGLFQVKITGADRKSIFTFKIDCGPGDDAAPVLTIMLPDED